MSTTATQRAEVTPHPAQFNPAGLKIRLHSPELKALFARIAEGASERESQRIAPHDQIRWLADAGLTRLRLPVEEGGAGVTLPELFGFLVDLAEADSNVVHILRVHYWFVEVQLQRPRTDPLRARNIALLNEGHVFGNGFSEQSQRAVGLYFETTLTPDPSGKGYRLNGRKYYSTGSLFSTYTQIFAATPENRIVAATIPVDRAGLTLQDDWDGFGQRLTGTGTTLLENVFVEEDEVEDLGDPDDQTTPSYQYAFLQLYLQAVAAGVLRAVRNDAVALVRRRKRNFSYSKSAPNADPQVLQVVGEIAADAFAASAIVLSAAESIARAAASVQDGVPDKGLAEQAQIAAAQAKVAIDSFANVTASKLFDAGGASATQSVYNLDRHWRNVRTASTHNPTFSKATAIGDFLVNGNAPPLNAYF